mgnify:CR=1 FL=1
MSAEEKKPVNPFYVALVILGTLFAVTACAYGVMMLVAIREDGSLNLAGAFVSRKEPSASSSIGPSWRNENDRTSP